MIACAGAFSAGWSLYVEDGKPTFHYNAFELATETINGVQKLPEGEVQVKVVFSPGATTKNGAGKLELFVNGESVGKGTLERSLFRHGLEPFEIGRDSITPVSPSYETEGDFEFNGKIRKIDFKIN